jgi:imidazole glycerol-phosphate synthase subunit HisF
MLRTRVIPVLLLKERGLVKTTKFQNPRYVGDPINAVKIFNEKEVDELVLLDITATAERREPAFDWLADISAEAFMPMCYGGGVRSVEQCHRLFSIGFEKVAINTALANDPQLIRRAAERFGNQSIVASLDVRRTWLGKYEVFIEGGRRGTGVGPVDAARAAETLGAGEVFLNSIDRDGTMSGCDLQLVRMVTEAVGIPVVACGGVGRLQDIVDAVDEAGASAVAAGSFFVFHGKHRAVLISYPDRRELEAVLE